jgi:hypothetical protein
MTANDQPSSSSSPFLPRCRKHGRHLRPGLYRRFNPMGTHEEAVAMERETRPTARRLRNRDYTVYARHCRFRYPSRRTLAWRRASRTAGPSTSGGRFVCWLVGCTVADPVPMMSWGNGCWRRDRQRDSLRTFSPWHIASNLRQGEGGEAGSWPGLGLDGTLDSRNSSTTAGCPFAHRATKVRPSQARSVWSRRRASRSRAKSASVLLSTRV